MNKKILSLVLLATLVGCNNRNTSAKPSNNPSTGTSSNVSSVVTDDFRKATDLKLVTPAGAPALAFLNYLHDDNYETNSVPANIIASMAAETYDIVVVDTIGGMNAITTKGVKYKMAATLTFGNYFIYSTGNDEDGIMNDGDTIISFGENQTPDKLFKYLFPDIEVTHYVAGVADTNAVACNGAIALEEGISNVDYVFMAEPVMFAMMSNKTCKTNSTGKEYLNIQDKYKEKNPNSIISGAALFVKNSTFENNKDSVLEVLNNLKTNINEVIANPTIAKARIETLGDQTAQKEKIGIAAGAAFNVLKDNNSVGLGYLDYTDNSLISKVSGYYEAIGMNVPSVDNYLK